ncbi:MAG: hypothetical protein NC489_19230 [Ruminococcus flavefaciens]|nr:hypothetical protein [Ruminococcus flavefaciens]
MKAVWKGKKVSGILTVLPENEYSFEDTILAENIKRVRRLRKIMGFDKLRRVKKETNASDLYKFGLAYMFDNHLIQKEEIGAIVVVTLTQDYLAPQISHILHGDFHLSEDVICSDIAQGCAGYIAGLAQAFMLLDHMQDKKVLLFTGDILNRKYQDGRKYAEPIFGGDAASISVIENDESFSDIYFRYYSDGARGMNLLMPAGAFKHPVYSEEDVYMTLEDGRHGDGLGIWMDGSWVFNFIMQEVPPLIKEVLRDAEKSKEEIEYFFFHQPNRYILEKLADQMNIPRKKMPMDIVEKYGNSNSSTIPVAITEAASHEMLQDKRYVCLSGFGSGLTWAAFVMEIGEMDFCEMIESTY